MNDIFSAAGEAGDYLLAVVADRRNGELGTAVFAFEHKGVRLMMNDVLPTEEKSLEEQGRGVRSADRVRRSPLSFFFACRRSAWW